jgi:gas vesicle protein
MEKSNNSGKVVSALLVGAVIGGAIGAALGILFAPEKGSITRKRLLASGGDLTDSIKGKFNELVEEVTGEVGIVKERMSQLVESGTAK